MLMLSSSFRRSLFSTSFPRKRVFFSISDPDGAPKLRDSASGATIRWKSRNDPTDLRISASERVPLQSIKQLVSMHLLFSMIERNVVSNEKKLLLSPLVSDPSFSGRTD